MPTEHGALLAGNHVYLSREDVAQIEAEAVAALRADLADQIGRLESRHRGQTVFVDRAAVLRLLTDGAEPPEAGDGD